MLLLELELTLAPYQVMPVYNRRLCQHRDDFRTMMNGTDAVIHVTQSKRSLFAVSSILRFDEEEYEEDEKGSSFSPLTLICPSPMHTIHP